MFDNLKNTIFGSSSSSQMDKYLEQEFSDMQKANNNKMLADTLKGIAIGCLTGFHIGGNKSDNYNTINLNDSEIYYPNEQDKWDI